MVDKSLVGRRLLYVLVPLGIALALFVVQDLLRAPPPEEQGRALYARMCALCHGDNGEGYAAPASPALANPNFLAVASDAYLFENTARGRPGTRMSAWADEYGGPLSEDEVRAIVAYVRSWQTKDSVDVSDVEVDGDANRGATVYAQECAVCHGEAGGGQDEAPGAPNGAPSLNNPVFLETASDGFIRYSIFEGRPGTPMPAYDSVLSDQDVDDLVALIRSWEN
ncbi:MAG: Cbb3-type cytochrome c oxidase subunit CcoP1 [Anaerolineales bacterium]|nr:Cbb3-type cytochrome c oxidase subunit CcoP1 [Anaerolineales bacterium]